MESVKEAKHDGIMHKESRKALRSAQSISVTLTLRANTSMSSEKQARTTAQHARVKPTPAIHHETTNKKWMICNHEVALAGRHPNANLSNLRFEDDIILTRGSLKHTTTMLDDLTTKRTARSLHLHSTNIPIMSNKTSKRGRSNTAAIQGVNIEIVPPEGKIKICWSTHHLQKTLEFEHRITCAWATFMSHKHGLIGVREVD